MTRTRQLQAGVGGRRDCIAAAAALGLLAATGRPAAQPTSKAVVGVLTPSPEQWRDVAFRERLREHGYVEGVNLELVVRSADAQLDRLPAMGGELALRRPDVIVAVNTPGARAAQKASGSIPIVMAMVGDPLGQGFVKSLARPEGNITGVSNQIAELATKRLGLLLEAVPSAKRIALLYHPDEPIVEPQLRALHAAGLRLNLQFRPLPVRTADDLTRAFDDALAWRAQALLRLAGQAITLGPQTAVLALQKGIASMLLTARDVEAGGLMSYYVDDDAAFRRVADYVHRILQGDAPGSLPVEQPTRFELVVNARTAQTLGLPLPQTLLIQANRVIE
jgi:putative ABC transport system substrate-binding protein